MSCLVSALQRAQSLRIHPKILQINTGCCTHRKNNPRHHLSIRKQLKENVKCLWKYGYGWRDIQKQTMKGGRASPSTCCYRPASGSRDSWGQSLGKRRTSRSSKGCSPAQEEAQAMLTHQLTPHKRAHLAPRDSETPSLEVSKLQLDRGLRGFSLLPLPWQAGPQDILRPFPASSLLWLNNQNSPFTFCETVFFHSGLRLDLSPGHFNALLPPHFFFFKWQSLQNFIDFNKIAIHALQQ